MLRLAADADVHGPLLRELCRRLPTLDLARAQDSLPEGAPDPEVLKWAASEDRVLLTNDRNTMVGHAVERIERGQPMPGLIVTTRSQPLGDSLDDLELIVTTLTPAEMQDRFEFLPL